MWPCVAGAAAQHAADARVGRHSVVLPKHSDVLPRYYDVLPTHSTVLPRRIDGILTFALAGVAAQHAVDARVDRHSAVRPKHSDVLPRYPDVLSRRSDVLPRHSDVLPRCIDWILTCALAGVAAQHAADARVGCHPRPRSTHTHFLSLSHTPHTPRHTRQGGGGSRRAWRGSVLSVWG